MKIRQALFPVMFLGILLVTVGCEKKIYPDSTQTLEVNTQPIGGSDIRLLSITSHKDYLYKRHNEVLRKLETTLNEGEYNITSVKTSYSEANLIKAEVTYDASGRGDGNRIRLMFIQSDKSSENGKAADIKSQLEGVINSGKYDIVKINRTYFEDYLLAAEVYYREKQKQ